MFNLTCCCFSFTAGSAVRCSARGALRVTFLCQVTTPVNRSLSASRATARFAIHPRWSSPQVDKELYTCRQMEELLYKKSEICKGLCKHAHSMKMSWLDLQVRGLVHEVVFMIFVGSYSLDGDSSSVLLVIVIVRSSHGTGFWKGYFFKLGFQ